MTVQKTISKNSYVGDGVTKVFPITFEYNIEHTEYIHVFVRKGDDLEEITNYTLDAANNNILYPAETSIYDDEGNLIEAPALAKGDTITIIRQMPLKQEMNLVNQGPYFAEDIEKAFDDVTLLIQQVNEKAERALTIPVDSDKDPNVVVDDLYAARDFVEEKALVVDLQTAQAAASALVASDAATAAIAAKDLVEGTAAVVVDNINTVKDTALTEIGYSKADAIGEIEGTASRLITPLIGAEQRAAAAANTAEAAAETATQAKTAAEAAKNVAIDYSNQAAQSATNAAGSAATATAKASEAVSAKNDAVIAADQANTTATVMNQRVDAAVVEATSQAKAAADRAANSAEIAKKSALSVDVDGQELIIEEATEGSQIAVQVNTNKNNISQLTLNKQDKLTAGNNITINNNVISATSDVTKAYVDEALSAQSDEIVATKQRISVLESFHRNDSFTYEQIQEIANNELLETYFPIGTQFNIKWKNTVTNTEYDVPLDVVHHGYFINENGETKKGMILQWHYCAYGIQFSNYQAFYKAETELPAGTYYITWGQTWGSKGATKDVPYSFTLTKPVQAGGFLTGFRTMGDTDSANWKVYNYANAYDQNPIETVSVVQGANGTNLGTLAYYTVGALNGMQQTGYGYNNYKQSAIRQWLNSAETKGNWWQSQNKYDMRPDQLFTYDGFMCGFDDGFLNLVSPVQQNIATNTVTDGGVTDVVCDKFWLPSVEQEYCVPQVKGVEGEYWEYWKDRLQLDSPQASGSANANANHIRYAMENHNSAQNVRLRSAYRSTSYITWYVTTTGYLYYTSSYYATRCAPACAIISKS